MRRVAPLLLLAFTSAVAAESVQTEAVGIRFAVPHEWNRVPASSELRAAQYRLPRAPGDAEDGELVLFFFGKGKGGSADDNLTRWYGQLTEPDGRNPREVATVTSRTVRGLHLTAVDVAGNYLGGAPGSAPRPGFRLLAAVVEGEGGPWFFKAVGPSATIGAAKPGFDALLESLQAHP
jgi:hypothetical protein